MKKIMFDDTCSLTQAVKEGRKTNTRRQEKALDKEVQKHEETYKVPFSIVSQYYDLGKERLVIRTPKEVIYVKPRYKVGEVVAVAQSYQDAGYYPMGTKDEPGWRNKMFVRADLMPLQIRITDVRVERLQDITEEDCLREGIYEVPFCAWGWEDNGANFETPREAFAALINLISGKGTWESNPQVYVYEFKLVKEDEK